MNKDRLKVFEAFSGVGSQRMALRNIGVDFEVVGVSEIDKWALKSYEAIHGELNNLGDISKLDINEIPDHDLFTYSFPCQDISVAGYGRSLEEGSNTRSSLLWECKRVIEGKKPKYLLLENVKNLISKKHKEHFDKWLSYLEEQGYNNYYKVLNAKNFGVPQNRERVFVVSILKEADTGFTFDEATKTGTKLIDIIEKEVPESFIIKNDRVAQFIADKRDIINFETASTGTGSIEEGTPVRLGGLFDDDKKHQAGSVWDTSGIAPTIDTMQGGYRQPCIITKPIYKVRVANTQGYQLAFVGDSINFEQPSSTTRRGRVGSQIANTLNTATQQGVVLPDFDIRKLTPLECWRLMGFTDEDYYKAEAVCSNAQLYKQSGNSIAVPVLESIFKNLLLK